MCVKARVKQLEKQVAEQLDLCPRCGGKHVKTWSALMLCAEEEGDEPVCGCEECGCAELVRELSRLLEEGGKDELGGKAQTAGS